MCYINLLLSYIHRSKMVSVLTADIGGTNARFQIWNITPEGDAVEVASAVLPTRQYPTLQECMETFLLGQPPCVLCVLGIAGIVTGHESWSGSMWPAFSYHDLKLLGFRRVLILNDLEASGYGVLELLPQELTQVNPGPTPVSHAPIVVISIGTGLGSCYLTSHQGEYQVWPAEDGFACFGPKTRLQEDYLRYLRYGISREKYQSHKLFEGVITNEVVLAGYAAKNMYDFMLGHYPELSSASFASTLSEHPEQAFQTWMEAGFSGRDEISRKCVEMYLEIIGGVAGNWALKLLSKGGVYLIGGVIQKNESGFTSKGKEIMAGFLARPNHTVPLLSAIPIYVVKPEVDVGLRGALRVAKQEVREHNGRYF